LRKDLDAFFMTTDRWHLTPAERRVLLGVSSEERWMDCLRGAAPRLNPQELARARGVIQIDEALARCVSDPREVARWFRTLKIIAPFSGRTPLALLLRRLTGFKSVAEYLAAWEATARESDRN